MLNSQLYILLYINLFLFVNCFESKEKLCANPTCTEPISEARGAVPYSADSPSRLSFKRNKEITIISKSRKEKDYWGAIIDGIHGYVPSQLIKETKVYHPTEKLITVAIEESNELNQTIAEQLKNHSIISDTAGETFVESDKKVLVDTSKSEVVQEPLKETIDIPKSKLSHDELLYNINTQDASIPVKSYNVLEGTTVYIDTTDEITPSPTLNIKQNLQTTATHTVHLESEHNTIEENNLEKTVESLYLSKFISQGSDNEKNLLKNVQKPLTAEQFGSDKENIKIMAVESDEIDEGDEGYEDDDDDDDADGDDEDDENDEDIGVEDVEKTINSESPVSDSDNDKASSIVFDQTNNDDNIIQSKQNISLQENNLNQEDLNGNINISDTQSIEADHINMLNENESSLLSTPEDVPTNFNSEEIVHTNSVNFEELMTNLEISVKSQSIDEMENKSQESSTETGGSISSVDNSMPNETSLNGSSEYNFTVAETKTDDGSVQSISVSSESSIKNQIKQNKIDENEQAATAWSMVNNPRQNKFHHDLNLKAPSSVNTDNVESPWPDHLKAPAFKKENIVEKSKALDHNEDYIHSEKNQSETSDINMNEVISNEFEAITKSVTENSLETSSISELIQEDLPQHKESEPQKNLEGVTNINSLLPNNENFYHGESTQPDDTPEAFGFFSWVTNALRSLTNSKTDVGELEPAENYEHIEILPSTENVEINNRKIEDQNNDLPTSVSEGKINSEVNVNYDDPAAGEQEFFFWNYWPFGNLPTSSNTFLYLVVTAITVLLFTLGHNFIENKGKTGPLIAKINILEQKLLIASREYLQLKDEIQCAQEKVTLHENSNKDKLVLSLQAELEESKKARSELEASVEVLQQELDAATEAGLDLNKMLSEVLTQKGGSESLLESVENLQAQLNSQQKVIDDMTKKLGVKNEENEILQTALEAANEKAENLEEQLNEVKSNYDLHKEKMDTLISDLNSQLSNLQSHINQLTEEKNNEILKLKNNSMELESKVKGILEKLTVKEEECKIMKNSFKQLKNKGGGNEFKLESLFDACQIKAELTSTQKENKSFLEKLDKEVAARQASENQVKSLELEILEIKKICEEAKQKENEAQKKLEVLSTYFKEKETQLQKELGLQEALWAQKKGDEKTVFNMMKSLQEEVESYKSQTETLKKEILDQERGLKNQIATLEQKAHENWVAARQAERKLEESKQETAQLRNRLTLIEKSANSDVEEKINRVEDLNGVEATSPIIHDTSSPLLFPPLPLDSNNSTLLPPGFMPHPLFMPPPMGGFIPPPPFLPGDRRPPPLGRMSSPPLNNRFSPPPPPADFPFERMPSPPLSPHSRNYRSPINMERDREQFRHRTPPFSSLHPRNWDEGHEIPGFIPISSQRDSKREPKGSNISSSHSSSDSLEHSSRHSGRI